MRTELVRKVIYRGEQPAIDTAIPDYVTRAAMADLQDGLFERCGITRPGAHLTVGAFNEWLTWVGHRAALDRWADDGGRVL